MKIALIGYGKMGKAIEPIAIQRGHEIVLRSVSTVELDKTTIADADVAIEFTEPSSAKHHILTCFEAGTPVVVGTTGWYGDYDEIHRKQKETNSALLASTNFSLGVNLFFEINHRLAALMNQQDQYDMAITEVHHTEKLDAPSGTAISIAEGIIDSVDRKKEWTDSHSHGSHQIQIVSEREVNVPGTHRVTYNSAVDSISIEHVAHNRKGFALGSVIAAEFIQGKSGIYTMKDVLNLS
ncbi:MAG: 4-hydroxy-tetrahydrodipicolinate reductase [Crocinitomicaceae bacterium]|nr:4-hydroxy-tetrahydrodipicolinate reductase [Crocinitomicaceae bacterium]